jgi:hypothetical protein
MDPLEPPPRQSVEFARPIRRSSRLAVVPVYQIHPLRCNSAPIKPNSTTRRPARRASARRRLPPCNRFQPP